MISSHITPSKRQFSAELEAKFQEFFASGNEPKRLRAGESGGQPIFYAGNAQTQHIRSMKR